MSIMSEPKRPIVNLADLEFKPFNGPQPPDGNETYDGRFAFVGPMLGAEKLGYSVTVIPPKKRAFQFHNHRVNEEMFFVLEGDGELRVGTAKYAIRAGDFIACPAGGPETAHQIVNTSERELKVLGISTKLSPEIVDYPESNKIGVMGTFPGADGKPELVRFLTRAGESLGYWDK
jgi:uncharacterized cupin superfamily protein